MEDLAEWAPLTLDIEKTSYTAEEFHEWFRAGRLTLSPDFQRGEVWKAPARSFLIDTMLRGFPIPPLHIRLRSGTPGGLLREVIDGQQRLTAVLNFIDGKFALTRYETAGNTRPPWAGKRFRQLESEHQRRILDYSFRCEVYKGQIDDLLVREIFSRINIYSVPLNEQEIRNGKFFGVFKQAVYELAREHEKFWLVSGIFTKTAIARMLDAQFVSEALVAEIAGQQDKKSTIDSFYHRYEEEWAERDLYSTRFRSVTDSIRSSVGDILRDTIFRRAPLYYTLFAVIYHRQYGLDQRLPRGEQPLPPTPALPLNDAAERRLADALTFLTDVTSSDPVDPEYLEFRKASSRQTDNIRPRLTRFRYLWNEASLSDP